jgi:hypothetical protein
MNPIPTNVKFCYIYRDAGNYKIFGEVVFSNPDNYSIQEINKELKAKLIDGEYFELSKCNIPLLAFEKYDKELDHDWMEFDRIELTNEETSDYRNISDFIQSI